MKAAKIENIANTAAFTPIHLRGAEEIARIFAVKPTTVRHWREMGAPIVLLGKKYQANYQDLWQWLKSRAIESDAENM